MGLPGFEPGSRGPKPLRLTKLPHSPSNKVRNAVFNILLFGVFVVLLIYMKTYFRGKVKNSKIFYKFNLKKLNIISSPAFYLLSFRPLSFLLLVLLKLLRLLEL